MANRKKILLVRLGGIGDTLIVLPSIRLLRELFPEPKFEIICRPDVGEIFCQTQVVDDFLPPDDGRVTTLFKEKTLPSQGELLPGEDYLMLVGWFNRSAGLELLHPEWRVRGEFIVGDLKSHLPLKRYFFDQTLKVAEKYGRRTNRDYKYFTNFPFSQERLEQSWKLLQEKLKSKVERPFGLVCPGSGSRKKCWPLDLYWSIIEEAARRQLSGFLITGPAEAWQLPILSQRVLPSGWFHIHQPPLGLVATLMRRAAFYLGNDSGLTHLAACCGVKGVALFLKENLSAWSPEGKIVLLSSSTKEKIDSASVINCLFS